jgi:tetratricopeptide (TPR) repeat protein
MAQAQVVISAVDRTQGAINSAMKGLRGLGDQASILKRAFAGIGAVAVGQFLTRTAMSAIQYGDELQKAAVKSGIAVEQLSALSYAAKQSDIDLGSLSTALRKMQVNLSQATSGGKAQKETLDALGISLEQLKNLAPDQQFELLADRINALTNPADKARAAVEVFGKAGADLLPLFEKGAEGIRIAREEAEALGLVISTDQVQKLAQADEAIKKLSQSFSGMARILTAMVAGPLTEFFNLITRLTTGSYDMPLAGFDQVIENYRKQVALLKSDLTSVETRDLPFADQAKKIAESESLIKDYERAIKLLEEAQKSLNNTTQQAKPPPGFKKQIDEELSKYKTPVEIPIEVRANIKALEDMVVQVDLEIDIEKSLVDMRDKIATQLGEGGELGETVFDTLDTAMKDKTKGMTEFARTAAENMQNAFAQFLFDPFKDGLRGMLANFVNMLRQMVAQIVAQQILLAFFRMFTGGTGFMADFANAAVKSIEGRAIGGPVSQGTPYIVGERGPELFVPNSSGSIVPNNRMGGVTVAPVYNIDARGATADLQQALPGILKENNRRIFDELDRRYGIGR